MINETFKVVIVVLLGHLNCIRTQLKRRCYSPFVRLFIHARKIPWFFLGQGGYCYNYKSVFVEQKKNKIYMKMSPPLYAHFLIRISIQNRKKYQVFFEFRSGTQAYKHSLSIFFGCKSNKRDRNSMDGKPNNNDEMAPHFHFIIRKI